MVQTTKTKEKTAPCLEQGGVTYIQLNRLKDVISHSDGTLLAYCNHRCHVVMRHGKRFYVVVATDEFKGFLESTGVNRLAVELVTGIKEDKGHTAVVLSRTMTNARSHKPVIELASHEFKTVGEIGI